MFVLKVLGLLFLIFVVIVIRLLFALFSATNKVKKQYREQSQSGTNGANSYRGGYGAEQPRRKQFNQNEGEYVEFEEIPTSESTNTQEPKRPNTTRAPKQESQISDAQYEEIN